MFWKALAGFIVAALAVYLRIRDSNTIKLSPNHLRDKYDFVIVGGGSAGCVLAARLSEDRNTTVLLIEAGGTTEKFQEIIDVPAFAPLTQFSEIDWQFRTEPQKHSAMGLNEKVILWPAGKVLGGSSAINMMTYVRGNPKDFDIWESLGNPGWSYADVLPFFKKLEKVSHKGLRLSKWRGKKGPVYVGRMQKTVIGRMFMRGIKNSGVYKKVKDYNGESQEERSVVSGFSRLQRNVGKGKRQSTASEYLLPVIKRPNLDVLVNAHATKVIFDKSRRAVGVSYKHRDEEDTRTVSATGEVLLSAGAVNSAQLLILSGIGPLSDLEKLKIPVLVSSPVGQNMKTHVGTDLNFVLNSTAGSDPGEVETTSARLHWKLFGKGPWESIGPEMIAFLRSPYIPADQPPDLQYIIMPSAASSQFMIPLFNFNNETISAYGPELNTEPGLSVICVNNHLLSTGRVWLESADPFAHPKIDPNYLENNQDVDALAFGLATFLNLTKMPEIAQFGVKLGERPLEKCKSEPWTADYFRCLVRHRTVHMYHPTRDYAQIR